MIFVSSLANLNVFPYFQQSTINKRMPRTIDHIVYAVFDLDRAIADFTQLLGIAPVFGGHHQDRGTKNALLNLGKGCYLEIIAIDEWNTRVAPPRWMGLDVLQKPQITRWCLKSENLAKDQALLKAYDPKMGEQWSGKRQTASGELLAWEMLLPLPEPEVEVVPFMVDWGASAFHPTERLEEKCFWHELILYHPEPMLVESLFGTLAIGFSVKKADQAAISLSIESPLGRVIL
ncbi:VOC family protein [Lewinella sp. LCG006]|uniref:VOC family protein n=1 Tax=Lewinella sp. LCG006 TaxID=3231911 RepID=UPI003460FDD7